MHVGAQVNASVYDEHAAGVPLQLPELPPELLLPEPLPEELPEELPDDEPEPTGQGSAGRQKPKSSTFHFPAMQVVPEGHSESVWQT